jgi:hypothetical protein
VDSSDNAVSVAIAHWNGEHRVFAVEQIFRDSVENKQSYSYMKNMRFLSPPCIYIHFKMFFYVARHLDSNASYLPTGIHLGFFCLWPSFYPPSRFSSVFLMLSFISAATSMLFWVIFPLPFSEHGRTT